MGVIILLIDTKFGPFCVALLSSRGIVDLPPTVAIVSINFYFSRHLLLKAQRVGKYLEEAKNLIRSAVSTFDEPASSSLSGGQWPSSSREGEPKYSLSTTKRWDVSEGRYF